MNGKLLNAQYKEHFSNYREWDQLGHASEYLVYPENMGPHLSIDITNDRFHVQNFFVDRRTNAAAESINAKVKAFRSQFRGVADIPFFLFRLSKLCA